MDAKKVVDKFDILGKLDELVSKVEAKFESSVIGKAIVKLDEFLQMDKFGGPGDDLYEMVKELIQALKDINDIIVGIIKKIINQIKEFIAALLSFVPGL
jgi:hypothetical protein